MSALTTFRRWLAPRDRTARKQTARQVRPVLEALEDRQLMTASINAAGNLIVKGTAGRDIVSVAQNSTSYFVTDNGVRSTFARSQVTGGRVYFYGYGENDWFKSTAAGLTVVAYADAGNDTVYGYTGKDTLQGGTGNDFLSGGAGDDRLAAQDGNDTVYGGEGADNVTGEAGNDTLYGQGGNDLLYGGQGSDLYWAGTGNDFLDDPAGRDTMYCEDGNDYAFSASSEGISAYGGAGNDYISAGNGSHYVSCGDGDDTVYTGDGNDTIYGGSGSDLLTTARGNDTVIGGNGLFVTAESGSANDTLYGGEGNDYLDGYEGNDFLYGEAGTDTLYGGSGDDWMEAGTASEFADGESGTDWNAHVWTINGAWVTDIDQEGSGTCSFLSTLAGATQFWTGPTVIYEGNFTYAVLLYDEAWGSKVWERVRFDGTMVADGSGWLMDPRSVTEGEFWTILYQRAYLQRFYGINVSSASQVAAFAGEWPDEPLSAIMAAESEWVASSTADPWVVRDRVYNRTTVVCDSVHCYMFWDLYTDAAGVWQAVLYNPWRSDATHESSLTFAADGSNDGFITVSWATVQANLNWIYWTT